MEINLAASADERGRLTAQLRSMSHSWAQAETERDEYLTRSELGAVALDHIRRDFNALSLKVHALKVEARRRANGIVPPSVEAEVPAGEPDSPPDEHGAEPAEEGVVAEALD